jgi:hypothetical protein
MTDKIPKSVLLDFITSYEEDNEPMEPESPPEPVPEEPLPEEPVEPEINCYQNDVSNNPDYMISKADYYDLVARHNNYYEGNGQSPNILALKEDGKCTGNYITLAQYQDTWSRWYTYIQEHNGEEPAFVAVYKEHPPAPAPEQPPESNGRGKEMHTAADNRWSYRTGYTNPIKQVNGYDCSVHSCLQVIYAMLGLDLSEDVMTSTALNNGWLDYSGASHWQLSETLNHFSNNQLAINWVDFSSLGFNGLFDILNDPQRDFIVHGGINCSDGLWGHYFLIRQSSPQLGQLSELRSICGAEQEYIMWEADFRNRINYISQPSIGIVTYR